jgi:hypothetical protein
LSSCTVVRERVEVALWKEREEYDPVHYHSSCCKGRKKQEIEDFRWDGGRVCEAPIVGSFQARLRVPILPPLLTMVSTLSNEESVSFTGAEKLFIGVP